MRRRQQQGRQRGRQWTPPQQRQRPYRHGAGNPAKISPSPTRLRRRALVWAVGREPPAPSQKSPRRTGISHANRGTGRNDTTDVGGYIRRKTTKPEKASENRKSSDCNEEASGWCGVCAGRCKSPMKPPSLPTAPTGSASAGRRAGGRQSNACGRSIPPCVLCAPSTSYAE